MFRGEPCPMKSTGILESISASPFPGGQTAPQDSPWRPFNGAPKSVEKSALIFLINCSLLSRYQDILTFTYVLKFKKKNSSKQEAAIAARMIASLYLTRAGKAKP